MTAPRLLLVEDDPDLAGLLTELLTSEGYDVDTAGDGQRGLHLGLTRDYDRQALPGAAAALPPVEDRGQDGQRDHPPDQHVTELRVLLDGRAVADAVLELLARGGAQRGEHDRGDRERERSPAGPGAEPRPDRGQQDRQSREGHDHHGGVHEQGMDRKPEDGVQHG